MLGRGLSLLDPILSLIKEMARGLRDGKIFRIAWQRASFGTKLLSRDKGMTEGFPDKKFCRPGHFWGQGYG